MTYSTDIAPQVNNNVKIIGAMSNAINVKRQDTVINPRFWHNRSQCAVNDSFEMSAVLISQFPSKVAYLFFSMMA